MPHSKFYTLALVLSLIIIVALTACGSGSKSPEPTLPVPAETRPPSPTETWGSIPGCGDGICEGPENAGNCPSDCEKKPATPARTGEDSVIPPVYITLAGHIEDVPIYTNCKAYPNYRTKLLQFAEVILGTGAAFNLQIEYEFFTGASECETESMKSNTGGRNVIDYLASEYGFQIDPHQEGGWEEGADNYADIRFFGNTVTPAISENVGGLVWNDAEQFTRLSEGETGRLYPDFTWEPEVLTLAVSLKHHLGDFSMDDSSSGIWKPKGADEDFWVHDPNGSIVYIGPGEHGNWGSKTPGRSTPEFVRYVAEGLRNGTLDRNKMYTASIAIPQGIIFDPGEHRKLLDLLDELKPLIDSGQAVYVTYSEAVDIWRQEYGGDPNIFFAEGAQIPYEAANRQSAADQPPVKKGASLYLTTMTHMEQSFTDDKSEDVFLMHVQQLRYALALANEYGARLTIESEIPFSRACKKWGLNMMQEVIDSGHGAGTHCDVGFGYTPSSVAELGRLYMDRKQLMDDLVGAENNRGYSGGGSSVDWILAGKYAGFDYKDGGVGMLYLSMPVENRPGPEWTDDYIRSEAYHDAAPVNLEDRIYPFLMADARDFEPDDEGILFSSGSIGGLDSMVEGSPGECPGGNCVFNSQDIEVIVKLIEEVDRIRDRSRIAKVDVYIPLKLFDKKNEATLQIFFEEMRSLQEKGTVIWATQGQVFDAFTEWNVE